ncbi:MAG TPA: RagB/SusD family nutrient uptake outer membrane protein [Longimicrobiales bacterium]|nr:RagB/SusD family nutrient uptake outer membrane protein [Longimicrobiales bacterium]
MTWKNQTSRVVANAVLIGTLTLGASACKDFLDVNTNPNAPQVTTPNNYLAPMIHWLAVSEQFDGRFLGRYTQMWTLPPATVGGTPSTWDRHGYDPTSDNAAQLYRDVYWNFGNNLTDMISLAEQEQRWDLVGIGYTLRAWGWLKLTSMHGDIIVSEAFTPDKHRFAFDSQEAVYDEIFRLLDLAIETLQRTDGTIDPAYVAVGDRLFNGDTSRWLKFAWGLRAMALSHFSNKAEYDPDAVVAAVDNSFVSSLEEALFFFPAQDPVASNDQNFWSPNRGNLNSYRQTTFVVGLMNGTAYPGAVDPRMSRMLAPDSTGTFRGLDPMVGYGSITRERPWNLWGIYGTGTPPAGARGRYLFDQRPRFPVMTYAQLQFIKAEAALRGGDQGTARQAYLNGISAHIDFVNARNAEVGNTSITPISATEKANFLAHPEIAPPTITLSHIMGQKFIAQWAWAHTEAWMDQLRYHYTDLDLVAGTQVFRGYNLPTNYYPDNGGQPAQRVRARYNSDYVWNRDELAKIGGLALDYHTKPMWITQP